jgi:hypothetical protein
MGSIASNALGREKIFCSTAYEQNDNAEEEF